MGRKVSSCTKVGVTKDCVVSGNQSVASGMIPIMFAFSGEISISIYLLQIR